MSPQRSKLARAAIASAALLALLANALWAQYRIERDDMLAFVIWDRHLFYSLTILGCALMAFVVVNLTEVD